MFFFGPNFFAPDYYNNSVLIFYCVSPPWQHRRLPLRVFTALLNSDVQALSSPASAADGVTSIALTTPGLEGTPRGWCRFVRTRAHVSSTQGAGGRFTPDRAETGTGIGCG